MIFNYPTYQCPHDISASFPIAPNCREDICTDCGSVVDRALLKVPQPPSAAYVPGRSYSLPLSYPLSSSSSLNTQTPILHKIPKRRGLQLHSKIRRVFGRWIRKLEMWIGKGLEKFKRWCGRQNEYLTEFFGEA
jgi:hypothetical protein